MADGEGDALATRSYETHQAEVLMPLLLAAMLTQRVAYISPYISPTSPLSLPYLSPISRCDAHPAGRRATGTLTLTLTLTLALSPR